jgi:hypothetical protein
MTTLAPVIIFPLAEKGNRLGGRGQGKRIKIFSRFNKGHRVSQGRNAFRPYRKIICTEPL